MKHILFICLATVFFVSAEAQNNLDLMGLPSTSPQLAYGLRKLSSAYTGPAIGVRRSSDNLEAMVYFDASVTPAVSSSSSITLLPGVALSASLGTSGTGTISTNAAKPGTISISVNKTGTVSVALGITTVTGTGTSFQTELAVGDQLYRSTDNAFLGIVKSIQSNTALTLNNGSIYACTNATFKTRSATVTGSGTSFQDGTNGFVVGDRIYKTDHTYLGTITAITSATTMTLNARDAVAYSGSYEGTTTTVTGSGTSFTSGDVGKLLIGSNNITLGLISSVASATSVTLSTKAGAAVSGSSYRILTPPADFGTFYSGTDVYVKTWYDQSGYARDAIQPATTTNQPKIVASGTLDTVNSKPSIQFSTAMASWLRTTAAATWLTGTLYTLNCVSAEASAAVNTSNYSFLMSTTGYTGPGNTISHFGYRTPSQYTVAQYGNDVNFTTQATTSLELHTAVKYSTTSSQFYKNGASLGTLSNSGATNLADLGLYSLGYYTPISGGYFNGNLSEVVVFAKALDATERSNMDNNQLAYFGIVTANWTGAVSTDWNVAGNWSSGVVPTSTTPAQAVIPAGCPRYPNITGTSAVNSLIINSGASVTVPSGGKLQMGGALSNLGTFTATAGTIELLGVAQQTFSLSSPVQNLIINNSAGVTLSGNLTVSGNLTFTSGYLSLGGLTLTLGGTVTNTVSGGLWGGTNSSLVVTGSPDLSFNQNGTYNNLRNLTINGSGAVATLTNNLVLVGSGTLAFTNGKLAIGSNTLSIAGAVTNTVSGGLRGNGSSNITVNGILSPTLSFDQTTPGTTNALNNFSVSTTSANTVGISGGLLVNGTLTISSGQTLNMGTAALGGTLSTVSNSGTIQTQNTSLTPLPTGKTWGGTVNYNSASTAQTAMAGTYNNLTIGTTGGATASGDITVNGVLTLAANPSSGTKGNLEMVTNYSDYPGTTNANPGYNNMVSYYLNLGATATITGTGDVTGIVKRTTIVANTAYTFGNQYTTVALTDGTMPNAVTVTLKIGVAPPHAETGTAVKRMFEIVPLVTDPETFTSTSRLSINFHYLTSELNGNTEAKLITADYDIDGGAASPDEHGRASYDFTNKYIGLSNVPISYFIKKTGHVWRTIFFLWDYKVDYKTWNGSASTSWNTEENWTPSGIPQIGNFVIIPNVTSSNNRSPELPDSTAINTMTIEEGGILVMNSAKLTISNSLSAGWEDRSGLSDPGTSKIYFVNAGATVSGAPSFYDVVVNNGADFTIAGNSTVKIKNGITRKGTGKFYAGIYESTVDYNNTGSQTVAMPDGTPQYHHLTLSGSGVKTMPSSAMTLNGNLTLAGSASTTAGNDLTIHGGLTIGSGTGFTAGSLNHSIGGNFVNDGSFTGTGSTIIMNGTAAQTMSGSVATTFDNLTSDNAAGVIIASDALTTVTGTLTINSGKKLELAASKKLTVSGTLTNSAGASGFIIRSDAGGTGSLIYNGSVAGSVQRYIANDLNWHFLSSPVTAQAIWPEFAPSPILVGETYVFDQTPWHWDFFYWNPNASTTNQLYWVNLRKNSNGDYNERDVDAVGSDAGFGSLIPPVMTVGRGYLANYGSDWNSVTGSPQVHTFSGTINGGSQNSSVINGSNIFNLAGNPYPSSIDWKASSGWDRSVLTQRVGGYDYWIYNATAGNYGVFNSAESDDEGTNGTSRYIAPMQGYFVTAASTGNIAMTSAVQTHSTQSWLDAGQLSGNSLRFRLTTQSNPYYDEMLIKVNPDVAPQGSMKFWSMTTEAPELYAIEDGYNYSIARFSEVNDQTVIPVGIKAGATGTYTLKVGGESTFFYAKNILLEDLKTGSVQNLKANPSYTFTAGPNDNPERFHLRFQGPYGVSESPVKQDYNIYAAGKTIVIRDLSGNDQTGNILVYNILGQKVGHQQTTGEITRIDLNSPAGWYIVTVLTNKGVISKKVFIR